MGEGLEAFDFLVVESKADVVVGCKRWSLVGEGLESLPVVVLVVVVTAAEDASRRVREW